MKKIILGSLGGSLILFIWGFLSWELLPVHFETFKHSSAQDAILQSFTDANLESGTYMVPMPDNSKGDFYDETYIAEKKKFHETMAGRSFATVAYRKEGVHDDPMTMIRGYLLELLSVFCVSLILGAGATQLTSFFNRWWMVMLIAIVINMQSFMMDWNWMATSWHYVKGFVFDIFISWGLCGAWLAWFYGRK